MVVYQKADCSASRSRLRLSIDVICIGLMQHLCSSPLSFAELPCLADHKAEIKHRATNVLCSLGQAEYEGGRASICSAERW